MTHRHFNAASRLSIGLFWPFRTSFRPFPDGISHFPFAEQAEKGGDSSESQRLNDSMKQSSIFNRKVIHSSLKFYSFRNSEELQVMTIIKNSFFDSNFFYRFIEVGYFVVTLFGIICMNVNNYTLAFENITIFYPFLS